MGESVLELPDGVRTLNNVPDDRWRGPYTSKEDAINKVPVSMRPYRYVDILIGGVQIEHCWKNGGNTINDLVPTSSGEETDPIYTADKPTIALKSEVQAEKTARENADTALSANISTEVTNRQAADASLQSQIDALASAINETIKPPEPFTPAGTYPTTYGGAAIKKGDSFMMSAPGTIGSVAVDSFDWIIALVNAPGQIDSNWGVIEGNKEQMTETVEGFAKVASDASMLDGATTINTTAVTPKKFWIGISALLGMSINWIQKQTFVAIPRFLSISPNSYLKVDSNRDLTGISAIPGADITQDATHRFATDTEKSTWSGKQDALGYVPVPNTRKINSKALTNDIVINKSDVGLGSVPNVDTTNAANIVSGQLPDARLSSNVDLLNLAQTITANKTFNALLIAMSRILIGTSTDGGFPLDVVGNTRLQTALLLSFLTGTSSRMLQVDSIGQVSAPNDVMEMFVTDVEVINAIVNAPYTSAGCFIVVIQPASSKTFFKGQHYNAGGYHYIAVENNVVQRLGMQDTDVIWNQLVFAQAASYNINGSAIIGTRATVGQATAGTGVLNITGTVQSSAGGIIYTGNGSSLFIFGGTGNIINVTSGQTWLFGATGTGTAGGTLQAGRVLIIKSFNDSNVGGISFVVGAVTALAIDNVFNTTLGGTLKLMVSTALKAALNIPAGVLLTAALDGTFEYDGSQLWFTRGNTRFQLLDNVPNTRTVNGKVLSADITLNKGDIGLANVDNTSDINKPVSSATQTALNGKQDSLGFTPVPNTRQVNGKALNADITITKSDVGLGNVDNTTDLNKPISTATQTALNGKQNTLGYVPVPVGRFITIDGVSYDLSSDRTFTTNAVKSVGGMFQDNNLIISGGSFGSWSVVNQLNASSGTAVALADNTSDITVNPSGSNLRIKYTGTTTKTFRVSAILNGFYSAGGAGEYVYFRFHKNLVGRSNSLVTITANIGYTVPIVLEDLVSLAQNDYIEIRIRTTAAFEVGLGSIQVLLTST